MIVKSFYELGGIPYISSLKVEQYNGKLLNETLQNIESNTILHIEGEYWLMGGIKAYNLQNITIILDGVINFSTNIKYWPRYRHSANKNYVLPCIDLSYSVNVTLTSSTIGGGIINGNGWAWWDLPGIGYLLHAEDRPRLLYMLYSQDTLLENWILRDAPYWTTYFQKTYNLEIRYTSILARRTGNMNKHSLLDMTAFNTDGLDVSGRNIYIHHCNIWCQDDTIAIKDDTQNVLVEHVNVSGVGITIGSIGNSLVQNITFRHCIIYKGWKGIYLKFRNAGEPRYSNSHGRIYNILYEDIIIYEPQVWGIWIGPAQQSDTRDICYANPCSICWPAYSECNGIKYGRYRNILFSNISIINPKSGIGVIMSHEYLPMQNITFHNVHTSFCSSSSSSTYSTNQMNFNDVFPYLTSSIAYDNYFISDSYIIQSFAITFIASLFFISYNNSTIKTIFQSIFNQLKQQQQQYHQSLLVLLMLISIICASTSYMMHTWYEYYNIDTRLQTYYSCENVNYGIATGTTHPVPHCFQDNTTITTTRSNTNNTNQIFDECSWYEQPTVLKSFSASMCLISFIFAFGYYNTLKRKRIKVNNAHNNGDNGDDDDDIEFANYTLFADNGNAQLV